MRTLQESRRFPMSQTQPPSKMSVGGANAEIRSENWCSNYRKIIYADVHNPDVVQCPMKLSVKLEAAIFKCEIKNGLNSSYYSAINSKVLDRIFRPVKYIPAFVQS
ncbi:hypothetical protein ACTXT7_009224 [Hymenolepis weldensis]